jgi:hypothetical protein
MWEQGTVTSASAVYTDVVYVGFVDAADLTAIILANGLKRARPSGLRSFVSSLLSVIDGEHEVRA